MVISFEQFEDIWRKMKANPARTIIISVAIIIIGALSVYGYAWIAEKGKQAAFITPTPSLPAKEKPEIVSIISGEIFLSGPGTYLISPNKISGPDNIITKISGVSKGDKVTLKTTLNVGEIVIEESDYIKMQPPIFCLRSTDDKITFTCVENGVCIEDSRINIGDAC